MTMKDSKHSARSSQHLGPGWRENYYGPVGSAPRQGFPWPEGAPSDGAGDDDDERRRRFPRIPRGNGSGGYG